MLGQGIARDRFWIDDALQAYGVLEVDRGRRRRGADAAWHDDHDAA